MDESKLDENRIGRKALDQDRVDENRLDENWAHAPTSRWLVVCVQCSAVRILVRDNCNIIGVSSCV